jgi:hypothetical protein
LGCKVIAKCIAPWNTHCCTHAHNTYFFWCRFEPFDSEIRGTCWQHALKALPRTFKYFAWGKRNETGAEGPTAKSLYTQMSLCSGYMLENEVIMQIFIPTTRFASSFNAHSHFCASDYTVAHHIVCFYSVCDILLRTLQA